MASPENFESEGDESTSPIKPGTQLTATVILRGFDVETGIATFSHESGGRVMEISAAINKKAPLYSKLYEILIANLSRDAKVPALNVRISQPDDDSVPQLLFAAPAVPGRRDQRFIWRGTELRWSEELDTAVDVDFDWKAQQFAGNYMQELINSPDTVAEFTPMRQRALEVFKGAASDAGLKGDEMALTTLFEKYAPKNLEMTMRGLEASDSTQQRPVRYDTRYSFTQQRAHVGSEPDMIAAALANFACQVGVVEIGSLRAAQNIDLGDGKSGSLAEAHQNELVKNGVLFAANPNLSTYKEVFGLYSHDEVRIQLGALFSGAMDIAGVPAAAPNLDFIEHQKKFVDPDKSQHQIVQSGLPKEIAECDDPVKKAGAYLATARNIGEGFRERSTAEVAKVQARNAPSKRSLPKPEEKIFTAADAIKKGFKKVEEGIDYAFG